MTSSPPPSSPRSEPRAGRGRLSWALRAGLGALALVALPAGATEPAPPTEAPPSEGAPPSEPPSAPSEPPSAPIDLGAPVELAPTPAPAPPRPAELRGEVRITRGGRLHKDRSGVVVYLERVPGPTPTPPTEPLKIRQHNKTFLPRVSAAVVGTTIDFPNDDKIFHNVFSLSRALRFDLGLYKSGASKSVVTTREGVVDIYCNIHPEMAAKVVILATTHFAVTGEDGSFALQGVPPGTYPVVAWQAEGEPFRGEVTLRAGEATTLTIDLIEAPKADPHLRKDGTPYGRYK
ncbi:MAG: carboxypeptidase regulatory-like domain-containing protein [Nannocystaceae bacterium]